MYFRCEDIDTDNQFVMYRLQVRSRQTWQPSTRVLEERSNLHRFSLDLAAKLGVQYDSPFPTRVIYNGGQLPNNIVENKKDSPKEERPELDNDISLNLPERNLTDEDKEGNIGVNEDQLKQSVESDEELLVSHQIETRSKTDNDEPDSKRSPNDEMFLSMLQSSNR